METGSYIRRTRRGFTVDATAKLGSLIPSSIVLDELVAFLDETYPDGGGGAVLDLGAGTKPYEPVYAQRFAESVAVDVPYSPHDVSGVDVLASADRLPFGDASFDCIVCTEVLEHCADPAAVLAEIARVLRPGGRCLLTTPFLVALHEMPHDYYRYTPSALRLLATRAGLEVTWLHTKGGYGAVAFGFLSYPWRRLLHVVAARTHRVVAHAYNPVVWLTLVLPQRAYVRWWRWTRAHPGGVARKLSDLSAHVALGYVTALEKRA